MLWDGGTSIRPGGEVAEVQFWPETLISDGEESQKVSFLVSTRHYSFRNARCQP